MVLSPPPDRFVPSGLTDYQAIERLIIQGEISQYTIHQIILAHLTVTESEEFLYEMWPEDKRSTWIQKFGERNTKRKWREIGRSGDKLRLKTLLLHSNQHSLPLEQRKCDKKTEVWPQNSVAFVKLVLTIVITRVDPGRPASMVVLAMSFFLVSTRFALLILMGLSYALINKILRGNEVNRSCRLQEYPKGGEEVNTAKERIRWLIWNQHLTKLNLKRQRQKGSSKTERKCKPRCRKR